MATENITEQTGTQEPAVETTQEPAVGATQKPEKAPKPEKATQKPEKAPKPVDQKDPRRRLVNIRLQRPANSKSKGQTISVNNYRYFIPYGKTVEVPFFIAEIARTSFEQDEQTMAMIDDLTRAD